MDRRSILNARFDENAKWEDTEKHRILPLMGFRSGSGIAFKERAAWDFLERVAGGEAVEDFCGRGGLPSHMTFSRWLRRSPRFQELYELARNGPGKVSEWPFVSTPPNVSLVRHRKSGVQYTEALGIEICEWIALGKSLRSFCAQPSAPNMTTVYGWQKRHPEFDERFKGAREHQVETFVDDIVDIADNEENSVKARVMIEARKWRASKAKPHIYGERVAVDVNPQKASEVSDHDLTAIATGSRE